MYAAPKPMFERCYGTFDKSALNVAPRILSPFS